MKRTFFAHFAASAMTLAFTGVAFANPIPQQSPSAAAINIGDEAPALELAHWIKGDPIATVEEGKVYIIEFWSTAHPRAAAHLTNLQNDYREKGVLAVAITDEQPQRVMNFLAQPIRDSGQTWNDAVGFALASDPDQSAFNAHFNAAGLRGLPAAFIIGKDQRIEWIGNPESPAAAFDYAVDQVVKGTWNRAAFKIEWERWQALPRALEAKDWARAMEILNATIERNPQHLEAALIRFRVQAVEQGDTETAYDALKDFASHVWDDPSALNAMARMITDDPALKDRNVMLAIGYAMRAVKLSSENDPMMLDTYARCWYLRGSLDNAIIHQEKAAALAGDDDIGRQIKATLEQYRKEARKGEQGG